MQKVGSEVSLHCIFCYKSVNSRVKFKEKGPDDFPEEQDETEDAAANGGCSSEQTELQKFLNFAERHFGKCFNGADKRLRKMMECCEDCLRSVRIFNECYHEYKSLELKLAWRLESVRNVMRFADKIPSRVKAFREGLVVVGSPQAHYDALTSFRQNFFNHCSDHLKASYPRVQLIRKKPASPSHRSQHLSAHEEALTTFQPKQTTGRVSRQTTTSVESSSSILLPPPPTNFDTSAPAKPSMHLTSSPYDDNFEMTGVSELSPTTATDSLAIPNFSEEKHIDDNIVQEPEGAEHNDDDTRKPVEGIRDYGMSEDDHVDSESSHDDDMEHVPSPRVEENVPKGAIVDFTDNLKVEADIQDTKPSMSSDSASPSIAQSQRSPVSDDKPPRGAHCDSVTTVAIQILEQEPSLAQEHLDVKDGRRQLRKLVQCPSCPLKFSNARRFELHQKSEHLEKEHNEDNESSEMSESSYDEDADTTGTDDDEDEPPLTKTIKRDLRESSGDDCKADVKYPSKRRGPVLNLKSKNLTIGDMQLEGIPEMELEHRDDLQCKHEGCSALKFNFPSELEKHSKFHGEFRCEKCETVKDFAADFALHQLEHPPRPAEMLPGNNYWCWKCGRRLVSEAAFLQHFIILHLEELNDDHNRCLICRKKFCGAFPIPPSHYAVQHDLKRLDPSSKPFYCNKGRCKAYFLKEHQQISHRLMVTHNILRRVKTHGEEGLPNRKRQAQCDSKRVVKCPHCPRKVGPWNRKYHMAMCHPDPDSEEPPVRLGQKLITAPNGVTKTVQEWVSRRGAGHACQAEGCARAYFTEFELQIHSKTHGSFSCGICKETCTSAMTLASHELEHSTTESETGREIFKCSRCRFKGLYRERYVQHFLKNHLGLEMDCVRCPICMAPLFGYLRGKGKLLYQHFIDQHSGSGLPEEKVEKCGQCPAYFLNKFQLDDHVKETHSTEGPRYACPKCGRVFGRKIYLYTHKKSVECRLAEQQLEFLCTASSNCGRRFETELELDRHLPICKNYLPVECPRCGKVFRGERALRTHMGTHDKSREKDPAHKPYVCDMCGKPFKEWLGLRNHLIFHQDPESWNFECSVCSKKCATKQKLIQHMRTHTKEKPFVCQTCGVKYAHLHNLRIHRKSKHGIDEGKRVADTSNFASKRKGKKLKKRVENGRDPDDEDAAL